MGADDDDEFWDDLLGQIRAQALVTVVGPDVTVVKVGNTEQTLSSVIGQRLAERYHLAVSPGMTMGEVVAMFLKGRGRDQVEGKLYRAINEIVGDLDPMPGDALRDLAAITDLRLFVSTTPDGLLAQAVRDIRSQGRTRELTASSNRPTSEQPSNEPEPQATDTVILSLFGRAAATRQYAIHEEDRLEWLHALLRDEASLPDWLTLDLRRQSLLFVGCEMPDWEGRFLLRMSSNNRLSRLGTKQFFVVGSSTAYEPSLSRFCETYCGKAQVQPLEMEPVAFVAKLRERWEELIKVRSRPPPAVDIGSPAPDAATIFISYMREDGDAAERLCKAIEGLGGDVWLDRHRLRPGDAWEQDLLTAIRTTVRLFVPIISANTEDAEEGYVFKEWAEAVDRSRAIPRRSFVVPVIVDDDYEDDLSRYRISQTYFSRFHYGGAPSGDPNERLVAMLTEEIRNMRRAAAL